ncbi:MAG TPA: VOC family protein [Thermoanaerobaculia bacterium]|nr:VOC family protein [Thermoanaerobaculia bacterium]
MLKRDEAFCGYSVDDVERAKAFYADVLGMDVLDAPMGALEISIGGGKHVYVYPKDDHQPATFTVFNIPTDDIDAAVVELGARGVSFEHYEGFTGADGIARGRAGGMGPDIAWFRDPAGNICAVLQP